MWRFLVLACAIAVFYVKPLCLHGLDAETLSNERFPVDRMLLEKHWNIDCKQAVVLTIKWLKQGGDESFDSRSSGSRCSGNRLSCGEKRSQLPMRSLKYCGLLFNTQGTDHHETCPDFQFVYHQLIHIQRDKRLNISKAEIALMERRLSGQCL